MGLFGIFKKEFKETEASAKRTEKNIDFFIDFRNGKKYKTVKIGNQVWMAENLAYKVSSGCWAFKENEENIEKCGYLYDWYWARDACPEGWHIPSQVEWDKLEDYLKNHGYSGREGTALKATSGWDNEVTSEGTDNYGFTALPGGKREVYENAFRMSGHSGFWWSSTELPGNNAVFREVNRGYSTMSIGSQSKTFGKSVRCIKDS